MTVNTIERDGNQGSAQARVTAGTTTCEIIDLLDTRLVSIGTPSTGRLVSTALTFKGSHNDPTNLRQIRNADGAVSLSVAVDGFYAVNPADFAGVRFLQIVPGSTEPGGNCAFDVIGQAL